MDYSLSLNYAVLDYAARQRSLLLYNICQMGKNAIAETVPTTGPIAALCRTGVCFVPA